MSDNKEMDAFHIFFDKHYAMLCSIAYNYLKDKCESKDVVQEVFIKIWTQKRELVEDPKAKYYLITAVKNNCVSLLRKKIHHYSVEEIPLEEKHIDQDCLEEFEPNQYIEKALETLPPKCAVIFKMSRLESMTYVEISEALQISIKTVENQMGKAIKSMKDFIKKHPIPSSSFIYIIQLLSNHY
ncbi:RNA polymerase sigma-70 factor [Halosquirtibacter xylanolyticus]|uniref:RNA polymerase sigma-70 factor n=1 Tax=Halosquirtibacter xylanolyticus TaxID=3374599 RepID=UPI003748707C|nr:RNA polymerase sigma-70 factor [Prolixibacteraceae bacterium]